MTGIAKKALEDTKPKAEGEYKYEYNGAYSKYDESKRTVLSGYAAKYVAPSASPVLPTTESSVQLVKNGKAAVNIIYPKTASGSEAVIAKLLVDALNQKFPGAGFVSYVDSEIMDEGMPEILVGRTNRAESDRVDKMLHFNGMAVALMGNKLVITAYRAPAIESAVEKFMSVVNKSASTAEYAFSSNNNKIYDVLNVSLTVFGNSYADYSIVLPKDYTYTEYRFAQRIQNYLASEVGIVLPLVTEDKFSTGKAFKIGTSAAKLGEYEYLINAAGGNVEMIADSYYGYDYMYNYCASFLAGKLSSANADGEVLRASYVSDLVNDGSENFTQKNGEVRVIFNNVCGFDVLSTTPGGSCMPQLRNPMIAEFYAEYGTDVLCLEEITPTMRRTVEIGDLLAEYGYAEVDTPQHTFTVPSNCDMGAGNTYTNKTTTPIYYNTNTLNCIASGSENFCESLAASTGIYFQWDKYMSWAVFEVKSSGERFIVVNVHFDSFENRTGDGLPAKKAKAETEFIINFTNNLIKEYGCPAIVGGDMNVTVNDKKFTTNSQFIEAGFADVKNVATKAEDEKGHFNLCCQYNASVNGGDLGFFTGVGQAGFGDYENDSVDHIYIDGAGKNEITFHVFDVLNDASVSSFADHCGMLIDFSFN